MQPLLKTAAWVFDQLKALTLFELCSEAGLRTLADRTVCQAWEAGENLLVEHDAPRGIYVLLEGAVSVYYGNPEGERVIVKLFAAPAVFGEMEALLGIGHLENVDALVPSVALLVPTDALATLLLSDNPTCFRMLLDVSARLCVAARNEFMLAFGEVEPRLASFFVAYAHVFGEPDGKGGVLLTRPLTQEQLAASIGVTVRSVQRTYLAWKRTGLLAGRGKKLVLTDVAALERMSGGPQNRVDYRMGELFGRALKP